MPLAPKIPIVGSAMCIDPPRPRFVPLSRPMSSANIPSGDEPLGEAVAVAAMRGSDHVGAAEWPTRTDGRGLLADRQVDETRHLAVAVQHRHPLFEPADHRHPAEHLDVILDREPRFECGLRPSAPCSATPRSPRRPIVLIGTTRANSRPHFPKLLRLVRSRDV